MIENNFHGAVGFVTMADMGKKVAPTTVKTSKKYKQGLEALARYEGKSVSKLIRDALNFYDAFGQDKSVPYSAGADIRMKMINSKDQLVKIADFLK